MLRIHDKPFLEYLIIKLKTLSFRDVILLTGYRGQQIMEYFGKGRHWGVSIRYSNEMQPKGTAGAIKYAENLIDGSEGDFLVLNGDSFLDYDYRKLIEFHKTSKSILTMALTKVKDTGRYGSVTINNRKEIVSFSEKNTHSGSKLINAGVYVMNKSVLTQIPTDKPCSLERDIFPKLIGNRCYGVPVEGYFIDIGTPESYQKATKEFKERGALHD
jgi:NDP-sugar pyrophosphorylase family protein